MVMKEVLKRKVPAFVQETPEFSVFLKWVAQNKIASVAQLKSVLNAEIKECQQTMKKNMPAQSMGTNTRVVRKSAKQLDFLKLVRDKIVKYV